MFRLGMAGRVILADRPGVYSNWSGVYLRWSREDGQKRDVYFFCYGNQNERGIARQTA